ncbi:MAG: hypothetical protein ACRDPM_24610 [Solirubrobacteraceae bacterium]
MDVATVWRAVLGFADGAELAPSPAAGCAGCRALSASAVVGVGGVAAVFGRERATNVPTTTAADVVRTSTARLRGNRRTARVGARRVSAERSAPARVSAERSAPAMSPRSCARHRVES